jgi:hypothetical protein
MIRKSKKIWVTYHAPIGNHPQPSQATRYMSSCYSAARGRIHVVNSFHTANQPVLEDNLGVEEVTPAWIEDIDIISDSELLQERPEDIDPKYRAYLEDQQESDDEDEDNEGWTGSAKRKRTAGVSQAPTNHFLPS